MTRGTSRITYTFVKADRLTGLKADISNSNLEPVHVATASTDPIDSGFKRAVADGDLGRSFRAWAHTFVPKSIAIESGLLAAPGEEESDWHRLLMLLRIHIIVFRPEHAYFVRIYHIRFGSSARAYE